MLTFPTIGLGAKTWELTDDQIALWQDLYPTLDVAQQCRSAWAWIDVQPNRRKTARGMGRFLVSWLNRAVAHGDVRRGPVMRDAEPVWRCPHLDPCNGRQMCKIATQLQRPERKAQAS